MADYDNPRPSSQPVGSTDPAVVKDDLITLDRIVTSTSTTETNRKGEARTTLKGLEVLAQDAFRLGAGDPQGNYIGGVSVYEKSNWTFTYNGQQWGLSDDFDLSTLPYLTTEADPNNDTANLAVRGSASQEYVQTEITRGQGENIGGKIFPTDDDVLADGMTVPAGITHLRVLIGGEPTIVAMSPIASGTVSLLSESGANIGITSVSFYKCNVQFPTVNAMKGASYLSATIDNFDLDCETHSYRGGWATLVEPFGAARYTLTTRQRVRDSLSDPTWEPDGLLDHYLFSGTTYVAKIKPENKMNTAQFGAYCDGSQLDSDIVEAAITYCIKNKINLTSPTGAIHKTNRTILILNQSDFGSSVDIDFNGATFEMDADVSLFDSAYDNAGVLTTNVGTPYMDHPSFGVNLHNFKITSNIGLLTNTSLRIQDWYQGTYIGEIYGESSRQILRSINNFYCKFGEVLSLTSTLTTGARIIFEGNHNLNDIRHLQSTNASFGYFFSGPLTATSLRHMSFEGMTIGARFEAQVYNCAVEDSYNENITDTHFSFSDPINSFRLSNNYLNFSGQPGSYLFDYVAGPQNNIIVEDDNTFVNFTDDQWFKTVDNTPGYSMMRITRKKKFSFSIDDFLVDNTKFPISANIIQPLEQSGLKTHQVNNFAEGIYAGRFTDGYTRANGFEWINTASTALQIRTKLKESDTSRIYVNIRVSASGVFYFAGELVKHAGSWKFYEYDGSTGVVLSSNLNVTIDGSGFIQINGTLGAIVTNAVGEVRLA